MDMCDKKCENGVHERCRVMSEMCHCGEYGYRPILKGGKDTWGKMSDAWYEEQE